MPIMNLPLNLPGERMTELAEETVAELVTEMQDWMDSVYSDGVLPGTKPPHSQKDLKAFYLSHTEPGDYELLLDNDYLMRMKEGVDRPPVSPFWLNALSSQGTFERMRREFLHVMNQDQAKTVPGIGRA